MFHIEIQKNDTHVFCGTKTHTKVERLEYMGAWTTFLIDSKHKFLCKECTQKYLGKIFKEHNIPMPEKKLSLQL